MLNLLKAGKLLNPNYVEITYYPACDSSFTSLYPALESIGINCDWDLHCRIASANGIVGFSGTVAENTRLLDLLKDGKLIDPDGGNTSENTGAGSFVNGYNNGYPGGMAGDGKIHAHGLDVSEWQGASLDFKAIKNAGYDYVILRAGTTKGKDTCFETYYTNARAAGLDIGAYYYTYATTVSGARTDADNMLKWISGKTFEYPIYFDYEDPSQDNLSSTTAKNICLTFCDAMAEAGYLAGVYAPDTGVTLYYWTAEDYNVASVLTASNATGKFKLEGSGTGEYRGDLTGISAKALSEAVYVACAYRSGGAIWTSGILGYSIGTYCSGQVSKGGSISDLAMATAVYGYHAKQYFG